MPVTTSIMDVTPNSRLRKRTDWLATALWRHTASDLTMTSSRARPIVSGGSQVVVRRRDCEVNAREDDRVHGVCQRFQRRALELHRFHVGTALLPRPPHGVNAVVACSREWEYPAGAWLGH